MNRVIINKKVFSYFRGLKGKLVNYYKIQDCLIKELIDFVYWVEKQSIKEPDAIDYEKLIQDLREILTFVKTGLLDTRVADEIVNRWIDYFESNNDWRNE